MSFLALFEDSLAGTEGPPCQKRQSVVNFGNGFDLLSLFLICVYLNNFIITKTQFHRRV